MPIYSLNNEHEKSDIKCAVTSMILSEDEKKRTFLRSQASNWIIYSLLHYNVSTSDIYLVDIISVIINTSIATIETRTQ